MIFDCEIRTVFSRTQRLILEFVVTNLTSHGK